MKCVLTCLISARSRAHALLVGCLLGVAVPAVVGALMVLAITGCDPCAAILCIRSHDERSDYLNYNLDKRDNSMLLETASCFSCQIVSYYIKI